jgi:hypothetical protein
MAREVIRIIPPHTALAKERAMLIKELCKLKMGLDIPDYTLKNKALS